MICLQFLYFLEALPNHELSRTFFIPKNFNFLRGVFRSRAGFELRFLEVELLNFIFEIAFVVFYSIWHLENTHQLLIIRVLKFGAATHLSVGG